MLAIRTVLSLVVGVVGPGNVRVEEDQCRKRLACNGKIVIRYYNPSQSEVLGSEPEPELQLELEP